MHITCRYVCVLTFNACENWKRNLFFRLSFVYRSKTKWFNICIQFYLNRMASIYIYIFWLCNSFVKMRSNIFVVFAFVCHFRKMNLKWRWWRQMIWWFRWIRWTNKWNDKTDTQSFSHRVTSFVLLELLHSYLLHTYVHGSLNRHRHIL